MFDNQHEGLSRSNLKLLLSEQLQKQGEYLFVMDIMFKESEEFELVQLLLNLAKRVVEVEGKRHL